MLKRLVFVFVLLAFATPASAQSGKLPKPFLRDTLASAEEYAEVIEACEDVPKGAKLVATCDQLVESFNRRFTHVHVSNHHELAAYVRNLAVKPLPSGKMSIARIVGNNVDLDYERDAREGELGLYDTSEGIFISSMSCGQWLRRKGNKPVFTAMTAGHPIAEAAGREARNQKLAPAKKDGSGDEHRNVLSLHRKSGKVVWTLTALGAGTYAAWYYSQPVQEQHQKTTIIINQ